MRHRKSGRQLNRNSSHRQAMFRNMAGSLVRHEIIKTTLPKAKELRRVVEPLITLAKTDSVANRRLAFARTRDNEIVAKLFNELGPRFASRAGGYTRILKCGFRAGDNAPTALRVKKTSWHFFRITSPPRFINLLLARMTEINATTPLIPRPNLLLVTGLFSRLILRIVTMRNLMA